MPTLYTGAVVGYLYEKACLPFNLPLLSPVLLPLLVLPLPCLSSTVQCHRYLRVIMPTLYTGAVVECQKSSCWPNVWLATWYLSTPAAAALPLLLLLLLPPLLLLSLLQS